MVFIDGGHSFKAANNDYVSWSTKIKKNGALVIHDIFENPDEGGQAPFEIFQDIFESIGIFWISLDSWKLRAHASSCELRGLGCALEMLRQCSN